MRNNIATHFSLFLMGLGFFTVVWVTSSLVAPARSQQPMEPMAPLQAPSAMPLPDMPINNTGASAVDENALPEEFAPSAASAEGYIYDPTGRRDPFKPFSPEAEQKPTGESPVISSDPLQMFDLSQYKLIGIVWDVKTPRAMVRDPQGKLFTLKKDVKIGRNNGFVSSIREGAVLVIEPAFADNGQPTAVTRVLLLSN